MFEISRHPAGWAARRTLPAAGSGAVTVAEESESLGLWGMMRMFESRSELDGGLMFELSVM